MTSKILADGSVNLHIAKLEELHALEAVLMLARFTAPNPVIRELVGNMLDEGLNFGLLSLSVAVGHPDQDAARVQRLKALQTKWQAIAEEQVTPPAPPKPPDPPLNPLADKLRAALRK